jgi:glyoxylase-like metal-dependent hydrolase (beta-lactamase superfamily II)
MRIADEWYALSEPEPGVTLITEPHVVRLFRANLFLVRGRERDLVVDSGMGVGDLPALLARLGCRDPILLTTHTHIDHIGGHAALAEVAEILVHPLESAALRTPPMPAGLAYDAFTEADRAAFRASGFDTNGPLIDALPRAGFDPAALRFAGAAPDRAVEEGFVIDLGNRRLEVLHLPGHSPGSIGLWDAESGSLFAGDAVYDGVLVDTLPGADVDVYRATMERLRRLPVTVVHGGHRASFGRERLHAIIDDYIASRTGARAAPAPTISF